VEPLQLSYYPLAKTSSYATGRLPFLTAPNSMKWYNVTTNPTDGNEVEAFKVL